MLLWCAIMRRIFFNQVLLLLLLLLLITIFKHGTISQYIKYLQKRKEKE